jgi:hypothetical protein
LISRNIFQTSQEREEMKKFIFGLSFMFLSVVLFAQPIGIDEAISKSAYDVSQWVNKIERNINRRALTINIPFDNTSPSLSGYIMPRLRSELYKNGMTYSDRENMEVTQQRLLDDYNTRRISDASAVPSSELRAARFIIFVKCEDKGNYYDFSLDIVDAQTLESYPSVFTVKKDSHIKNITKNDKKSDLRLLTGFGNIFFGLGSYISGDRGGGAFVTTGEVIAGGLILIELYALKYENALAGWVGPVGVGVGGLTLLYGFVRPYTHSRNPRIAEIADNVNIAVIPSNDKSLAVSLSYKIKF